MQTTPSTLGVIAGPELEYFVLARLERFAGRLHVPVELHAGRLEHADRRVADLRPDTIARDERYRVPSHQP